MLGVTDDETIHLYLSQHDLFVKLSNGEYLPMQK